MARGTKDEGSPKSGGTRGRSGGKQPDEGAPPRRKRVKASAKLGVNSGTRRRGDTRLGVIDGTHHGGDVPLGVTNGTHHGGNTRLGISGRDDDRAAAALLDSLFKSPRAGTPSERPLKVYAFDPSLGRVVGNYMNASVRYEELRPGPIGKRFAVLDFDSAGKQKKGVDLDDPRVMIGGGLDPTEADPRFHQQMVYAVASETLQRFEYALGRRITWRKTKPIDKTAETPRAHRPLALFPHAMCEANAFYDRDKGGILFGYFSASQEQQGSNLPGQTIFTCLSHDIIAHETTHAIVDGVREYFLEATNADVAAFHEAFADIAALFAHFSYKEALLDALKKTGGQLFRSQLNPDAARGPSDSRPLIQAQIGRENPLVQLALQFGEASGMHGGLRSALGTPPNSDDIRKKWEPHERGSILVAAVFDAYFTIYLRRTTDLFRLFQATGGANSASLPAELAERLAAEASQTAKKFFTICARALDYTPPVDITFGDFLRAVITADMDLHPSDPDGVRDALMQAFRMRGIVPEEKEAKFFSEESLCWPRCEKDELPRVEGLQFGDPNGLTKDEKDHNGKVLQVYAAKHANKLGFNIQQGAIDARSFHPLAHMTPDGSLFLNMVVELVQSFKPLRYGDSDAFQIRSGVTLLIAQDPVEADGKRPPPWILFKIPKLYTREREERARDYLRSLGQTICKRGVHPTINFRLLHAEDRTAKEVAPSNQK